MSRPRIRTLKPEMWQDEAIGQVTIPARLLFVGLITQADDEGRLRAQPALLRSQVFPYDFELPLEELGVWLGELEEAKLVVRYESEGRPYIWLPGWKNQRVDRANPSELPPPPRRGSSRKTGEASKKDRDQSSKDRVPLANDPTPRARPRIGSDQGADQGSGNVAPNGATSAPAAEKIPDALAPFVPVVESVLSRVAEKKPGAQAPTAEAVANVLRRFPRKDFVPLAEDYAHWALHGRGAGKSVKDVVRTYRNWIEKEPDVLRKTGVVANGSASSRHEREMARTAKVLEESGT